MLTNILSVSVIAQITMSLVAGVFAVMVPINSSGMNRCADVFQEKRVRPEDHQQNLNEWALYIRRNYPDSPDRLASDLAAGKAGLEGKVVENLVGPVLHRYLLGERQPRHNVEIGSDRNRLANLDRDNDLRERWLVESFANLDLRARRVHTDSEVVMARKGLAALNEAALKERNLNQKANESLLIAQAAFDRLLLRKRKLYLGDFSDAYYSGPTVRLEDGAVVGVTSNMADQGLSMKIPNPHYIKRSVPDASDQTKSQNQTRTSVFDRFLSLQSLDKNPNSSMARAIADLMSDQTKFLTAFAEELNILSSAYGADPLRDAIHIKALKIPEDEYSIYAALSHLVFHSIKERFPHELDARMEMHKIFKIAYEHLVAQNRLEATYGLHRLPNQFPISIRLWNSLRARALP